ncbi:hypothetical protein JS528_07255 [Bifidobacterium sp. MA2]|uniref:Uncharacterized protein n=1 Tax=Bifidobacterium santillanense TaxID=2809028 RepID=A0ABS5UQK4_9BIFI|nr:hypothetical protein [Bifidobacterium santillanense]MBT1173150.1 hypothetical protein [Bifidobacterium santillanense]
MTELLTIGHCRGYDLLLNPLNQRIIAERKEDLATALFESPSLMLVHQWGCPDEDVQALREYLRHLRLRANSGATLTPSESSDR